MRRVLGLLLLLGVALQAHAADLRMKVDGEIGVDGKGEVFDYIIKTIVTPQVKQLIDRSVRGWKFEPVIVNGNPGYAKSRMSLTLLAREVPEGYQLQVERVYFTSSRQPLRLVPPSYPKSSARAGITGAVLLALRVDAAGEVQDVIAMQTLLHNLDLGPSRVASLSNEFEKVSIKAAKGWRYTPADLAAGEMADATLIVPVHFELGDDVQEYGEKWQVESAGAMRTIPWLATDQQQFDASGLRPGEKLALGSPIKLVTQVVGKTL